MSEQQPDAVSGEASSTGSGPAAPDMSASSERATVQAAIESPQLSPDQEETAPKADAPKADAPKADAPKVDAPKVDPVTAAEPHFPGKVMILSPGDRAWNGESSGKKAAPEDKVETSGKRRIAAMAAVVALATVAGAIGGALATAGLGHLAGGDVVSAKDSSFETTIARLDADLLALKASVEHTTKIGMSQFNKTSDRLDKVEKAQAEPAAKLAKLSEAVEKLRAAAPAIPVAAAVPAAAKDVTGAITPPPTTTAAAEPAQAVPAKPEIGRLPTVEGWVLRDVSRGVALIENRRGMYEVYTGDSIPGLGRVDAIRKQDGRWVVVTTKGLIVAR